MGAGVGLLPSGSREATAEGSRDPTIQSKVNASPEKVPPPSGGIMPAVGAAVAIVVVFVVVLSIPLETANRIGLSPQETTSWIIAVWGVAGVLAVWLAFRFRQPLLVTGNIFILILISRVGGDYGWPELVGASIIAGIIVLVIGPLGVVDWLTSLIPPPIVFGLLAGAVFPFVLRMLAVSTEEPWMVGSALVVYLGARRWTEPIVPAILPALVVAIAVAVIGGNFEAGAIELTFPAPVVTVPEFSLSAMIAVAPVMVVFITLQANIPSVVFLREQGYQPDQAFVNVVSGTGTTLGSLLGPTGISLSLPATALVAGPDAGDASQRYRAVYMAGAASAVIAALAGFAVAASEAIPQTLLFTAVGLAVLSVLIAAVPRVTDTPLRWGPVLTLVVAASDFTLLGLSEFFWAIIIGIGGSFVLEREAWKEFRSTQV